MKFSAKTYSFLILLTVVLFFACAKQVAITGGPKDITPPMMDKCSPANGSVNFIEKTIFIQFNEYVKFNSLSQKLIVSPPIEPEPVIVIKGKGIKINLNSATLLPNTTYSFNFNDAIADNNENNSLNSFVYAFSTGDLIDSLSFSGIVLDSYTKEPVAEAWVILYANLSDTAINTLSPSYITKVDDEGKFVIPFVRENDYHIFALKDNNYNYIFDVPGEGIAFLDSVFRPGVKKINVNDSIPPKFKKFPDKVELLMFQENKQSQFINYNSRLSPEYLEFAFNSPQTESYSVTVEGDNQAVVFGGENVDTVKVWLREESIINSDLVNLICVYTDPIYTDTIRTDTISYRSPEKLERDSITKVIINPNKEPHKPLYISSNCPIWDFDDTKISIGLKSDSVFIPVTFKIKKDTLSPMRLIVDGQFLEKSEYRIITDNGFLVSIYDLTNPLDTFSVATSSSSEYGNLKISLTGEQRSFIIQLLSGEDVIAETIANNGIAEFEYIKPGTYKIKAIEDINGNKRWDTGDYSIKKQPEPVYFMPVEYEIRSNWNHDVEWSPITKVSK